MGIGFSFTAAAESEELVMKEVDLLAGQAEAQVSFGEHSCRIHFCPMGDLDLFFAKSDAGDCTVEGECQTTPAGAGFHKAAVCFADALSKQVFTEFQMDDETEYFTHWDFQRMQKEHFYSWLTCLVETCEQNYTPESYRDFCLCWDLDQYIPENIAHSVVTPVGRFHIPTLCEQVKENGIEAFARRFFIWNEPEKDALFYRNCALQLLWEECYFMPSARSDEDESVNRRCIELLEKAWQEDRSLSFPVQEYRLLCKLDGREPQDVSKAVSLQEMYTAGYRRGLVRNKFGNLTLAVPGHYLFQYEEYGDGRTDCCWFDGLEENWHSWRVTGFHIPEGITDFHENIFAGIAEKEIFEVGGGKCCAGYAGRIREDGEEFSQIAAEILSGDQATLITVSFEQEAEKESMLALLREANAALPDKE